MNDYNIQDLILAGVYWEISDVPEVMRVRWSAVSKSETVQQQPIKSVNPSPTVGPLRCMVVPPISPIQTITPEAAESMASRPTDCDNLIRMLSEFNHPLRNGATQFVYPNIAKNPNGLLVITDVPGSDDDATGNVLSGTSGELFDKMLTAIGMSRDCVSIIPISFWRTPGGRTPTEQELALIRPFISRLLDFLKPRVLLTLGTTPAQEIAGIKLSNNHGVLCEPKDGIPIMPIYHPNYLLLKPSAKREVWTALQELQKLLKN